MKIFFQSISSVGLFSCSGMRRLLRDYNLGPGGRECLSVLIIGFFYRRRSFASAVYFLWPLDCPDCTPSCYSRLNSCNFSWPCSQESQLAMPFHSSGPKNNVSSTPLKNSMVLIYSILFVDHWTVKRVIFKWKW